MKIRPTTILLTLIAASALWSAPAGAEPTPAPSASIARAADAKPTTTASGLQYVDTKVGTGKSPKPGQTVVVNYTISIGDRRIESSRSSVPFQFAVGRGQALKGLDEGVATMKAGGQRKLMVPPSLGYGSEGAGGVPPNATLLIDVELLEVR
jgi:peptidylprolyl isomerase